MKINHEIVLEISEKTKCPILELDEPDKRGYWFVIFDEYNFFVELLIFFEQILLGFKSQKNLFFFKNSVKKPEKQLEYFQF